MKKYSQNKEYKVIAYCISRFHRDEQQNNIHYMCKFAEEYHCKILVFSTLTDLYFDDINDNGEKQIYSMMDVTAFDAIVIMSETFKKVDIGKEIAERAAVAGVPVISVNKRIKGCVNIDFNYAETFEKIVRHIVEDHGCSKVNYIGGDRVSKFSRERFDAYKKVLAENNIPFEEDRTGYGNFRDEEALEVLEQFLQKELPEAIICANDTMAVAVCGKLKSLGVRVPEDVKITGFDGLIFERYHDPRLTTAVYDWETTARTILETAVTLSEGKETEKLICIPYKYQVGHSCGCENNYVHSATEKIFEYEMKQGMREEFYQEIVYRCSKANKCEEFSELLRLTNELISLIRCKEYWLCFKEDIWDKIVQKEPSEIEFELLQEKKEQCTGEEGYVLATHVSGQNITEARLLSKGELVPGLSRRLDNETQFMFIPVHLQGLFVGYIAVSFEMKEIRFDFLNSFCMNLRGIIESYWSRSAQEQLMCKDELTNLYNEKGYMKKIKRLFANGEVIPYFTLIVMDIDNLKFINDCYGHAEGDGVIKQLGKMIEQAAVDEEICARTDGDEFAVATMSIHGRARAQEIQDFLERRLADYNLISGKPFELSVSVGSYSGENVDWLDYELLNSQADKEMYLSKQNHKNQSNRYNY